MLLHFLHAAANAKGAGWAQVHAFTFGTRLTNITRHLRHRDVDAALAAAGREALDWEGGTRIGACLHAFNRDWSRRVLGQGAVVLLITDGLDRDDPERLGVRDGAAAPVGAAADLAEPAAALGRLRAAGARDPGDAAACRQPSAPATASPRSRSWSAALGRGRRSARPDAARADAGGGVAGRPHWPAGSSSVSTSSTKPPILPPVESRRRAASRLGRSSGGSGSWKARSGARAAGSSAGRRRSGRRRPRRSCSSPSPAAPGRAAAAARARDQSPEGQA